jgi:hypothetical protein
MTGNNTARFTSPLIIGAVVTGISEGTTTKGRLLYSTKWSGIYDGVQPSQWTCEPVHAFHDGIIGETPQHSFTMPVSHFPVIPDTFAPADVREQDRWDYPHDEECPRCGRRQWTDEHAQDTCQACGYVFTDNDVR